MSKTELLSRVQTCRVVPVLTISDASKAVDMARALIEGGIDVLEITLRTEAALDAIARIKHEGLDCLVGAGTVLSRDDVSACCNVGADFLVTPATPEKLVPALLEFDGLVLPGAATPTEALSLYQSGFDAVKFFPAEAAGGANMLKSLSGPLPQIRFMPTGGLTPANAGAYLALPNVLAIGGSWLCTERDVTDCAWQDVTKKALAARQL